MRFEKWQALGNDYLIVEADSLPWELTAARVRRLCDPHFGIGSDGVLLLSRSEDPEFVAELRIFNPDGSEAELSGNGAREAILYLRRHGWTDRGHLLDPHRGRADHADDHLGAHLLGGDGAGLDDVEGLSLGRAGRHRDAATPAGREWDFQHVSIGNPQCAIDVGEELESLDLGEIGPPIEGHELFPNRTNVSFLQHRRQGRVRARIFERGVGETLSSGTGASGAAVAAFLGGAPEPDHGRARRR